MPAIRFPPHLYTFENFTAAKPDFRNYKDFAVQGVTIEASANSTLYGIEIRGDVMRWGGIGHEESALGGPRVTFHFRHFSPYGAFLAGGAHAWYYAYKAGQPPPTTEEVGVGLQWKLLGGVDFHLDRRISLRLGEVSYSQIYEKDRTLAPIDIGGGVVLRVK